MTSSNIIPFPPARYPSRARHLGSGAACQPAALLSQAKATEGKAGMAGVTGPVRRSTAGTGLRVGEAGAVQPATSEFMDVTAGRDRQPILMADPISFNEALYERELDAVRGEMK